MANEFKHKDPGTALTQSEFIASDGTGHIFDSQAAGDILYASSTTVLARLAKATDGNVLELASGLPAWTASPTIGSTSWANANHAHAASNSGGTLTTVGALDAGSITSNFGTIDTGASAITTTGLISGGSLDIDNVLINGTTIGHTCDTDLLTLGNATLLAKGTVTVGVDDTGHDVKFFGAAAGSFALWDEDLNLLELRGATAAGPGHLKLTTGEATVVASDVLGKIDFQAPAETGTDAIVVSASIAAVAQDTFAAAVNATDLIFYTGHSEVATEKFRFTSQGEIGIGGANYGTDGQVLTSGGAGAAAAWESAGSSDISVRVYNNAAQTIATACDTIATFTTESYDTDTMHGTNTCQSATDANSKLTAKTAGKYHISAGYCMGANATGLRSAYLRLCGSTSIASVRQNTTGGAGKPQMNLSTDYCMGACDYVQLMVFQDSGGNLALNNGIGLTWLAMHKFA